MREVPWFNPSEMDDATVLALSTGRDALMQEFLGTVGMRLSAPSGGGHWLATGMRGGGKSYFLRLAQVSVVRAFPADQVRFVALPEELPNVNAANEWLDEITRMLSVAKGDRGRPAQWRTQSSKAAFDPAPAWNASLHALLAAFPEPLLVVGVENFSDLLKGPFADPVAAALLRRLMSEEPRLLLLATAVDGAFDQKYGQRLFRAFDHYPLPPWGPEAHRHYLAQRAALLGRTASVRQLSRIDAYSRYTGGNARVAAILAATLLDDQDLAAARDDLHAALDKVSDYYRALIREMPAKSGTLFDALVRDGDPCSQSDLAERVGAQQKDISRAFSWLVDAGHLIVNRDTKNRNTGYSVADRLFVQWYRMRYLAPGQPARLAVLAELLADALSMQEKWHYAQRFAESGEEADAQMMGDLMFRERGIRLASLLGGGATTQVWLALGQRLADEPRGSSEGEVAIDRLLQLLQTFPSDDTMRAEMNQAWQLASACDRYPDSVDGTTLATRAMGSLSLSPVEKLTVLRALPSAKFSSFQWNELNQVFVDEVAEYKKLLPTEAREISALEERRVLGDSFPFAASWFTLTWHRSPHAAWNDLARIDAALLRLAAACVALLQSLRFAHSAPSVLGDEPALAQWATYERLVPSGSDTESLLNFDPDEAFASVRDEVNKNSQILLPHARTVGALLQALVAAWPDGVSLNALGWCLANITFFTAEADEADTGTKMASAARAVSLLRDQSARTEVFEFALKRLGWTLGQDQQYEAALSAHQEAINAAITRGKSPSSTRWHCGQAARYLLAIGDIAAAMDTLAQLADAEHWNFAFGQLGDAVWDRQRTHGNIAAYTLARSLLNGSAADGSKLPLSAVRQLFISMIDTGVDLDVVQDLTDEWPQWRDAPSEALEAETLAKALSAWVVDLRLRGAPPTDGSVVTTEPGEPTDSDWETTLAALNEALSHSARVRLKLAERAVLSEQTRARLETIQRFLR